MRLGGVSSPNDPLLSYTALIVLDLPMTALEQDSRIRGLIDYFENSSDGSHIVIINNNEQHHLLISKSVEPLYSGIVACTNYKRNIRINKSALSFPDSLISEITKKLPPPFFIDFDCSLGRGLFDSCSCSIYSSTVFDSSASTN